MVKRFADFIVRGDNSDWIEHTCNPDFLNDAGKRHIPGAPEFFFPIFFRREVLHKYYNSPQKYTVYEDRIEYNTGFVLPINNYNWQFVTVMLGELGALDYEEQLYWRAYNRKFGDGIDHTGYDINFLERYEIPQQPNFLLIREYRIFQETWMRLVGWPLFKKCEDCLLSLHMLTEPDNEREFKEQILNLSMIFVDSINVNYLPNYTEPEKNKSINRLELLIRNNGIQDNATLPFMRNVQRLRSTRSAHPGDIEPKIKKYFKLDKLNLDEVLTGIMLSYITVLQNLRYLAEIIHKNMQK